MTILFAFDFGVSSAVVGLLVRAGDGEIVGKVVAERSELPDEYVAGRKSPTVEDDSACCTRNECECTFCSPLLLPPAPPPLLTFALELSEALYDGHSSSLGEGS